MFCKNCGSNLPDDAKFCATCGTVVSNEAAAPVQPAPVQPAPVQPAPVYAPAQPAPVQPAPVYAPAQPSPTMTNFVAILKGYWAKPIATVGAAAKSNTHEWSLLAAAGILTYALSTAVVGLEMLSQFFGLLLGLLGAGGYAGYLDIGGAYPFFAVFGIGLLIGSIAYFGTALGIWVLVSQIFKKNVSFINVLNMTAVACLPLTVIHVFNMIVGLVLSPLTIAFFVTALGMTAACLYTGLQKLDKLDKSPFYGFSIVFASVALITFLFGLLYAVAVGGGVGSFFSSFGNLF